MSDHTMLIKSQVNEFFKAADAGIEKVLQTKDVKEHNEFLKHYIREFPTLGDCVYEHIFRSEGLEKFYPDYRLEETINGIGHAEVEKSRRNYHGGRGKPFYIHYYHKYILKKTESMKAVGMNPELEQFLKNWQDKLEKQGYLFQRSNRESATARNIAFHLAFALNMKITLLKDILLKCLLQQTFNPKNHKECIYWYCLTNKISYAQMRSDYLDHYNSAAFDEKYRNSIEKGIANDCTLTLIGDIGEMRKKSKEEFLRYLWRLKYTEKLIAEERPTEFGKVPGERVLRRGTPMDVYWENVCHFVDKEDPTTLMKPLTEEEYAARYPVIREQRLRRNICRQVDEKNPGTLEHSLSEEEYEARFMEIWQQRRRECYEKNQDPLMDTDILKELFSGIDYAQRGIDNRKRSIDCIEHKIDDRRSKGVDPSRMELIATQFIACCPRNPSRDLPRTRLRKDFLKEAGEGLVNSGLRPFYLGAPFELFVTLCFLHEDPFCYFMASWEAAVHAGAGDGSNKP